MSKKDTKKQDEADGSTETEATTPTVDEQSTSAAAQPGDGTKDSVQKEDIDPNSIQVKVYSPYQTYYDAAAKSISAENDTGPFDILPRHHNFMTLVNPCEVVIRVDEAEDKKIRISRGVMHVRSNKVTLFLDV